MTRSRCAARMLCALFALGAVPFAVAQVEPENPPELEPVSVDEQLNAQVPLQLEFVDTTGKPVKLGDYFDGERPVIITLNYFRCPMLCGLQLNGLVDGLRTLSLDVPDDFEIVTVGFDPLEGPSVAKPKKDNYIRELGKPDAAKGWHFLTGKNDQIKALTSAVGFNYYWNEDRGEWAHPAAAIICTPDGRISRYLGGILFEEKTLRLSLVEASDGKIGSLYDQVFLSCFHYDPQTGTYAASAWGITRAAMILVGIVVSLLIGSFWVWEYTRKRGAAVPASL